jgi:hypothetical protein
VEEEPLNLFEEPYKTNFTARRVQSGGTIPDFQIAHVDKYGQIVADFDSKIRIQVDKESYVKDNNTKTYSPMPEGNT